jgi:hypothetical protein
MKMLGQKVKHAILGAAAIASMALVGTSSASATTIDGISFLNGAQFDTTTVYENQVTAAGQTLTGIGQVNQITAVGCNAHPGNICWQNGDNGYELTFTFSYTLEAISLINPTTAQALFSGGMINFYADSTPDFTPSGGADQVTDFANASNGDLWLALLGGATGDTCNIGAVICMDGVGTPVTLNSTFPSSGALGVDGTGAGHGFLDVNLLMSGGGLAGLAYDQNSQALGHDITLDTSFSNVNPTDFPISGSATLKANTHLPEAGTLSLLGAGLMLLGFGAWRRKSVA